MHGGLQQLQRRGKSSVELDVCIISPAPQLEANNVTSMGYGSNASSALSVTTGMGFMAMFLWTMFSLL